MYLQSSLIIIVAILSIISVSNVSSRCCNRIKFNEQGEGFCGGVRTTRGSCCSTKPCNIFCCACGGDCIREGVRTKREIFPNGETVVTVLEDEQLNANSSHTVGLRVTRSISNEQKHFIRTFTTDHFAENHVELVNNCVDAGQCFLDDDYVHVSLEKFPSTLIKPLRVMGVSDERFQDWKVIGQSYFSNQ